MMDDTTNTQTFDGKQYEISVWKENRGEGPEVTACLAWDDENQFYGTAEGYENGSLALADLAENVKRQTHYTLPSGLLEWLDGLVQQAKEIERAEMERTLKAHGLWREQKH